MYILELTAICHVMTDFASPYPFASNLIDGAGGSAGITGGLGQTQERYNPEDTSKLLDKVQKKLAVNNILEKDVTIEQLLSDLSSLKTDIHQDGSDSEIDLVPFIDKHEYMINFVLMFYSIYPTQCEPISLTLKNDPSISDSKYGHNFKPLVKPTMPEDSLSESEESENESNERPIPPALIAATTRDDNTLTMDAFKQMLVQRGMATKSKTKATRKKSRSKYNGKYNVNYANFMAKISELIDLFEFFKDFEKHSTMVIRLQAIIELCRQDIITKHARYNNVLELKNALEGWNKQSEVVKKNLSALNSTTDRDPNVQNYITDLAGFFNEGNHNAIDNLPLSRVANELSIAQGMTNMCHKLMAPLMLAPKVACPVCLDNSTSNLYAAPCGHIICETCLDHMATSFNKEVSCPSCRRTFTKSSLHSELTSVPSAIKLYIS